MRKFLTDWFARRLGHMHQAKSPESAYEVIAGEEFVTIMDPAGERRTIPWADLRMVTIETDDSGPWGSDVWWYLEGDDDRIGYPQGAKGDQRMLEAFGDRLPGFDHLAVIEAMGSVTNARFVCWKRSGESG